MHKLALIAALLTASEATANEFNELEAFAEISGNLTCSTTITVLQKDKRASGAVYTLVWGMIAGAAAKDVTEKLPFEASIAGLYAIVTAGCILNPDAKLIDVLRRKDKD
ncbi:MAG: hypothetical protein CSA68_07350 [Rhodobacterales bacterium]|nr:MAG: hypothetical protein CSA68_07350 [Rhodobacterales bacterium]